MLVGQALQGFDAVMPSQRFQGAPSTPALRMIAYSVFQSDFHFGMGSAPKKGVKSQNKDVCSG
jgi:hypothetical protein